MSDKLIIYELNELPKKLLNYYIKIKPNSNLSYLKDNGVFLDTYTTDIGELHPWTTWPTFYRGVDNTLHKITSINQDRQYDHIYPPIWEKLLKKNKTIGIFGSLQSFPPIDDKKVKFYLPDTFSPNFDSYPKQLETFQKFNLKIVNNNSGEIRGIRKIEIKYFFDCLLNKTIRKRSLLKIILQLIFEKFNTKFRRRRSLLQPHLAFDIYQRYLEKLKPDFSTFFTNHLAGMMHYYWLDVFPKDFDKPYRNPNIFNKKSVIKALDIADWQIGLLMKFAQSNSYQLWIASSMGQQAIERKKSQRIFLRDFPKILKTLNLKNTSYKILPSMYPDVNIESDTENNLNLLIKNFLSIKYLKNNQSIFEIRYKNNSNKVNLIFTSNSHKEDLFLYKGKKIKIEDFGLEYGNIEQGTGYHIPQGVLLAHGESSKNLFSNLKELDTKKVFNYIMKLF